MALTSDDVAKLATLARLRIDPEESGRVLAQLGAIMSLIDELQSVDTSGVAPTTHVQDLYATAPGEPGAGLRLRDDAVTEEDRRADYQSCAPAVERGLYLVPRVIE